jgi:dipeptidyl aminopeptidase/acylaminoacyl peptidase
MRGGNRFWYRNKTGNGHEFILVDAAQSSRTSLFDHNRLASVMSVANDSSYIGRKLPFNSFEFVNDDESVIGFRLGEKRFECNIRAYSCEVGDTIPSDVPFIESPNGEWEAFIHEYDLWIRAVNGGDSTQLTTDGERYWAYGISEPGPSTIIRKRPVRPVLQWSPDSRKIAVERMDERNVEMMPLYSSTKERPEYYLYPYALPGDTIIPRFDIYLVDVETTNSVRVQQDPQPWIVMGTTGVLDSTWTTVKWRDNGSRFYFTHGLRGTKRIQLMEADVETGETRLIVKDTTDTYIELNLDFRAKPNWDVLNGGDDVLWFSERDGWGHLYRFDGEGNLKNQVTSGPWTFGTIVYIDEATDQIYFTARGREPGRMPLIADFYRVNLDGSGLTLLGGEEADHTISVTPSGQYFVDQFSRVDMPPTTVVLGRNGRVLQTLEVADISGLDEVGYSPPEPFTVKAADGVTDIYGIMHKPSNFDPEQVYPIVEHIYPGPFIGSVGIWNWAASRRGDGDAIAELGFVVVEIDHRATPFRAKALQDSYYGNMGDNGIPDHIAAIRQLAARYSFIDIDRVGIYGHSGGGFASTDAILRYPDFYKVAVSESGNHDNRTYHAAWGEKYQGLLVRDTLNGTDNYQNQVNANLAGNLTGKLFLIHGDMDDNVHPAMTIRVADALIKANKSFDFLIATDQAHGVNEPYYVRRKWDYFVRHLMGQEPPENYTITRPEN